MDKLKNLVRFRRASSAKRTSGGVSKRGAVPPLRHFCGRFLILMRFIDPRIFDFNEIHGPNPGPEENMQIGGLRGAISQIWPKFREMLGENPADIHL